MTGQRPADGARDQQKAGTALKTEPPGADAESTGPPPRGLAAATRRALLANRPTSTGDAAPDQVAAEPDVAPDVADDSQVVEPEVVEPEVVEPEVVQPEVVQSEVVQPPTDADLTDADLMDSEVAAATAPAEVEQTETVSNAQRPSLEKAAVGSSPSSKTAPGKSKAASSKAASGKTASGKAAAAEVASTKSAAKRPAKTASAKRERSRATLVTAALAALAAVFVVVAGVIWWQAGHSDTRGRAIARDQVALDARLDIEAVNTSDYHDPSGALAKWLSVSTGSLHGQFAQSRTTAQKLLAQAKIVTTATVLDAAVIDLSTSKGTATVIASVDVRKQPTSGSAATARNRYRASMKRVGNQWKIADLSIVSVQLT